MWAKNITERASLFLGTWPQWSEKPIISTSLRAAVTKVVQRLFIHEGFLWINILNYSSISWWLISVKSSRFCFNYLMLIGDKCCNCLDMCISVIVLICWSIHRISNKDEAVGSLVVLCCWPHFGLNKVPFMFCSSTGSNLLFVCVFVIGWISFVVTRIWGEAWTSEWKIPTA